MLVSQLVGWLVCLGVCWFVWVIAIGVVMWGVVVMVLGVVCVV